MWKQCGERALSFPYRPVPAAALHRWHVRMHAVHRLVQGFKEGTLVVTSRRVALVHGE